MRIDGSAGGRRERFDSWTSRFPLSNGISFSTGTMKPKSASARPMLLYTPEKDGTIMERAAAAFEEDLRSVSQYCEEEILSSLSQSGDEGCVQVAFEWSEVVAAARGISSRNNMGKKPTDAPVRKMRSLHPYYSSGSEGDRDACERENTVDQDDDNTSNVSAAPAERTRGGARGMLDPWEFVMDEDWNAHLPPTLEQAEQEAAVDGEPLLGPDDEPIGVTSVHAGTVLGSDGAPLESLKYGMGDLDDQPQSEDQHRNGDGIIVAPKDKNEDLENHNACLSQRIRELEDELEYKNAAIADEVKSLNARIRDLSDSLGDNMAAAAKEFASLNERLKAKEAELRAKEIDMQGLLEQQDEAKQLILVLQQQQQGGKKDEGERDTVNQQPQGQEGQTGLVESPTPGIESTSSASSTAAPVVLKKRLSPRSQLLAMARPPLAPPPKPPVGYDQPNGVPEKKDMTMRIPLPNATLLGSTPPSKTISGEGEKYDNNNGEKGGNNGTNREEHDKELQPTKSMSVPSKELDAARLVPQRSLSMQRGLFGFFAFCCVFFGL